MSSLPRKATLVIDCVESIVFCKMGPIVVVLVREEDKPLCDLPLSNMSW